MLAADLVTKRSGLHVKVRCRFSLHCQLHATFSQRHSHQHLAAHTSHPTVFSSEPTSTEVATLSHIRFQNDQNAPALSGKPDHVRRTMHRRKCRTPESLRGRAWCGASASACCCTGSARHTRHGTCEPDKPADGVCVYLCEGCLLLGGRSRERTVLPVWKRIHCGTWWFCFMALARVFLTRTARAQRRAHQPAHRSLTLPGPPKEKATHRQEDTQGHLRQLRRQRTATGDRQAAAISRATSTMFLSASPFIADGLRA